MIRRIFIISLFLLVAVSGIAWMQAPTPTADANGSETPTVTPMILGAIKTATPTALPPKPEDLRPSVCKGPYQADWEAHVVEAGDTLASLMAGKKEFSVTQIGALNCIDDPATLPVGSVVWLPPSSAAEATAEACQQLVTTLDCAVPAQIILSARQLFQNGMMLWREDTREIWVISNNSTKLQVFEDSYKDGEAEPTANPPNTFFVPKRGFGKVWVNLGSEKSVLGWATAPEAQISLTVQQAGRTSYTSYIQLPDSTIYAATVLPHQSEGWWITLDKR